MCVVVAGASVVPVAVLVYKPIKTHKNTQIYKPIETIKNSQLIAVAVAALVYKTIGKYYKTLYLVLYIIIGNTHKNTHI